MKRLLWIDHMKVIGMFFIIVGHFFPQGYEYIYVFNVPVFFVLSGYLCKPEIDHSYFFKKIFYTLLCPLFILNVFNFIIIDIISYCKGNVDIFYFIRYVRFLCSSLIGAQSGVKELWYVYTLVLLKIVDHFVKENVRVKTIIFVVCLAWMIKKPLGTQYENAIENVFVAYPFFLIGGGLSKFRLKINDFRNIALLILGGLLCVCIICYCGDYNGYVQMYRCMYGNSIILFLLGGIAGTAFIYAISKLVLAIVSISSTCIAKGTILILGLQMPIIHLLSEYANYEGNIVEAFVLSLLILLFFIPLIKMAEKYFPIIIGQYVIKA